jgi:predicted permease
VALVSDVLSDRLFGGSSGAVGRELIFRDIAYTIVGVLPSRFRVSAGGPDPIGTADVFTPLGQENDASMVRRDTKSGFRVVGRLASDVGPDEVRVELEAIASRLKTAYPGAFIASSFLTRSMTEEFVGTTLPRTLMLLFSAVVVLFLIASANVANLVLARSVSRREEFAIRAALGAGRRRLLAQCLTESLCLSLAGGAGGVVLAQGATAVLVGLWPGGLPRAEEVSLDWGVLVFAVAVSLVTGLAFGLIPAGRLLGAKREDSGIAGRAIVGRSRRAQSALVVSELAMTLVLLAAAGATVATMLSLWSLDPGFEPDSVLAAELLMPPGDGDTAGEVLGRWNQALDAVRSNPAVAAAALTSQLPLTGSDATFLYRTTPEPLPTAETPTALTTVTTAEYREVMNIPLLAGRYFSDLDRTNTELVVVIDEVLAEAAFPNANPLGRKLFVLGERTVVGVVGHVRHSGLRADDVAPIREQMYLPLSQLPDAMLLDRDRLDIVAAARSAPEMAATAIRTTLERGGPWSIPDLQTMNSIVRDSSRSERFILYLFNGLGVLALVLSAVGLYGVVAYLARQRAAEFGLRMALGAEPGQVGRLVLVHALRMFVIGTAIGLALIIALSRVWSSAVENAEPVGAASIGAAVAVLGIAVLLASYGPLRRASRIDPMAALRHE